MSVDLDWPFQIHFDKNRYHQIPEMIKWCDDNIGEGGYLGGYREHWSVVTAFGKSSWLFKTDHDATLFALRWA